MIITVPTVLGTEFLDRGAHPQMLGRGCRGIPGSYVAAQLAGRHLLLHSALYKLNVPTFFIHYVINQRQPDGATAGISYQVLFALYELSDNHAMFHHINSFIFTRLSHIDSPLPFHSAQLQSPLNSTIQIKLNNSSRVLALIFSQTSSQAFYNQCLKLFSCKRNHYIKI